MRRKKEQSKETTASTVEDLNTNDAPEVLPPAEEPEVEVLPPEANLPTTIEPVETLPIEFDDGVTVETDDDAEESSKDLARYDALTSYLRELRRYPKLTREEEHSLALRYHQTKEVEAAYKLVASNLWLVVKIARDYEKAAKSLLDLIQEGNIGLMEAVKNFDPYRNVRFPSYAVWWVRAYIVRYIIANWRMVKIGTTQAQRKLFFNLHKEKERLEREGFKPEPKLIADRLSVKESEVIEMEQRLSGADVSVDTPFESDSESNLLTVLPSSEASAEDLMASKQMRELIFTVLGDFEETLSEKERVILKERMLSEEKVTLQEIADKLKLSKERIRQLENKIRDKLKEFVQKRLGSTLEEFQTTE